MYRLLLPVLFCLLYNQVIAQVPDFISVRKANGRTVKSYTAGMPIVFETKAGTGVQGWIAAIRNDSVFVQEYVVQRVINNWGLFQLDTLGSITQPVHYKSIARIKVFNKRRFIRSKIDKLLILGGTGYFVLNLANGAYLSQPVTDKDNLRSLGISLGAIGTGLLIQKAFPVNNYTTRRHRILYINMQQNPKPM